eukprot:SAG31_NODE_7786_length_1596_cov_3.189045_2_plen_126_part_00
MVAVLLACAAQAVGSWSVDACCAVPGNACNRTHGICLDHTSSSDWLFGLWPGPPQRFEPTGTPAAHTSYQMVEIGGWPRWGGDDLDIGKTSGHCDQGQAYRGTTGEICGGRGNWGATNVEVWYPI